jgi:hypothetical protein
VPAVSPGLLFVVFSIPLFANSQFERDVREPVSRWHDVYRCGGYVLVDTVRPSSMVTGLWHLSDRATAALTEFLYNERDQGLAESVLEYANAKIAEARAAGTPEQPFCWASFLAVGVLR